MAANVRQLINNTQTLTQEALAQFRQGEMTDKAVIILGKTGVGKSTLINMIAGLRFRSVVDPGTGDLRLELLEGQPGVEIGHKMVSETFVPKKTVIEGVSYWDCPGWKDNRGHYKGIDFQIANAASIKKIFEVCREVKLILAVKSTDFDQPRPEELLELVSAVDQLLLGQFEQISSSMALVVMKHGDKTKDQLRNKIKAVRQEPELHLSESQSALLKLIQKAPITLVVKFPKQNAEVDTRLIKERIVSMINGMPFAEGVEAFVGLPPECKQVLLKSYNGVYKEIQKAVNDFIKNFGEAVTTYAQQYSQPNIKIEENQQKNVLDGIEKIVLKLHEAHEIEYSIQTIPQVVDKCLEIVGICGQNLQVEDLQGALGLVETLNALEQFLEKKEKIPLEIVQKLRIQIFSSLETIEKARINLTAANEREKAEKEKVRADQAEKKIEEEQKKYLEAERRAEEATRRQKEAEARIQNHGGKKSKSRPKIGFSFGSKGVEVQAENCVLQ